MDSEDMRRVLLGKQRGKRDSTAEFFKSGGRENPEVKRVTPTALQTNHRI